MRRVAIVTTAAPPWLTGTAVNPSLRAAYLSKAGFNVCIAFPWIPRKDQLLLYGRAFDTAEQQEEYIRNWMLDNAHFHFRGDVVFYEAAYDDLIGCIIQKRGVAIVDAIPQTYRDVAILEEPEHLNWVNYEALWTDSFRYVVGVIHTNYSYYAEEREGRLKSRMTVLCNKFMCQTYTDTNLHLSSATLMSSKIPGAVCVIHGVREKLFDERNTHHTQGIYFVAKALWAKGYKNLVQLYTRQREPPAISTFGSGPDFADITDCILRNSLPICHLKGREHNGANFGEYRTFFNPSDSDALCTTTAEALAMGKYVILPVHPCNEFFYAFVDPLSASAPVATMLSNTGALKRRLGEDVPRALFPKLHDENRAINDPPTARTPPGKMPLPPNAMAPPPPPQGRFMHRVKAHHHGGSSHKRCLWETDEE